MSPATGSPARKTRCSMESHVPSVGEVPRLMQLHPSAATAATSYHRAENAKRRACETFRAMWDRTPPAAGVLQIGNRAGTCGAQRTRPQMDRVRQHRRRCRNHPDAHPDRRAPALGRITPLARRAFFRIPGTRATLQPLQVEHLARPVPSALISTLLAGHRLRGSV